MQSARTITRMAPSHPLCLLATGVLLLNDHALKALWPGTITGKLSDVCWLIVAPVVVASVLAWARTPARWARWASVISVGVAFVTLQLWPPLGDSYTTWFGGKHTPDLTDLLALPALALAAVCWRPTPYIPLALPVSAVACVATSYLWCDQDRAPLDGEFGWDPNLPLMLSWGTSAGAVAHDSYGVVSNIHLFTAGEEVPFVAASLGSTVFLCPVGGLLPDTEYRWVVDPMTSDSSNQVDPPHFQLIGARTFTTASESVWPPAQSELDCDRLARDAWGFQCAGFDTGFFIETGF